MENVRRPAAALAEKVCIESFGPLRGRLPAEIGWTGGTRAELEVALAGDDAGLKGLLRVSLLLVDGRPANKDHVPPGFTIQILPPISGG